MSNLSKLLQLLLMVLMRIHLMLLIIYTWLIILISLIHSMNFSLIIMRFVIILPILRRFAFFYKNLNIQLFLIASILIVLWLKSLNSILFNFIPNLRFHIFKILWFLMFYWLFITIVNSTISSFNRILINFPFLLFRNFIISCFWILILVL